MILSTVTLHTERNIRLLRTLGSEEVRTRYETQRHNEEEENREYGSHLGLVFTVDITPEQSLVEVEGRLAGESNN